MNHERAVREITEIRERMARSQDFRGFAPLAVAATGLLAFGGGAVQRSLLPSPAQDLGRYLALWTLVAALGFTAAAWGIWSRSRRNHSQLGRQKTIHAVEQVLPSLVVGGLLTLFVYRGAPEAGWMLPGLWSLVFGLGAFAARPLLSPASVWVGVYYVAAGTLCLSRGQGLQPLAAWQMELCFGGGQLLGAAILYRTVERADGPE